MDHIDCGWDHGWMDDGMDDDRINQSNATATPCPVVAEPVENHGSINEKGDRENDKNKLGFSNKKTNIEVRSILKNKPSVKPEQIIPRPHILWSDVVKGSSAKKQVV